MQPISTSYQVLDSYYKKEMPSKTFQKKLETEFKENKCRNDFKEKRFSYLHQSTI